jgi:hypothetical protein
MLLLLLLQPPPPPPPLPYILRLLSVEDCERI